MESEVTYDSRDNLVVVRVSGEMNLDQMRWLTGEVIEFARGNDCDRALLDLRACRPTSTVIQLYDYRVRDFPRELARLRRAVVTEKVDSGYRFYETVSVNRGQPVRVFTDIDAARAWLLSGRSEDATDRPR